MSQTSAILKELVSQLNSQVAPELSESDYFELFCNEQILKDYDLSYDEIEMGTVGNGGDGGIDGVYLFVNEVLINADEDSPRFKGTPDIELHIIQSKNSESFGEDVVQKFISSAEDIFDLNKQISDLNSVYDGSLLKHVEKFREIYIGNLSKVPTISINYYYASRGEDIHPNVSRKVESLKSMIKGLFTTATFNFEFLTATKLFELANRRLKSSFTIKLKENAISTEDGGYICIAQLDEYFKFISDENRNMQKYLFDANVRDYQGGVTVNKEILNTLKNESQYEFWWLNNGITIVTDNASVSSKILSLKNPQVVNGCQTSYEIHSYFTKNDVNNENRCLTIRVIVTEDEDIKAKVIKSTNSQTSIPPAILSATDPIHRSIEQHFLQNNLYYDRRKNFWKNEGKPKKDIISISYLAQVIKAMIVQQPHISRGKPSTLIKNKDDYKEIFNKDYDLDLYLKAYKIARLIEEKSSELTYLEKGDWLNIRYFVFAHFINRHINRDENMSNDEYIDKFLETEFDFELINDSAEEVFKLFEEKGKTDGVAKAKYFTDEVIINSKKDDNNAHTSTQP
jgi:hypothetical protein